MLLLEIKDLKEVMKESVEESFMIQAWLGEQGLKLLVVMLPIFNTFFVAAIIYGTIKYWVLTAVDKLLIWKSKLKIKILILRLPNNEKSQKLKKELLDLLKKI